jgi:hypothetical protein
MPFDTRIAITAQARRIVRPHIAARVHRNSGGDDSSRDHIEDGGDGFGVVIAVVGGRVLSAGDLVDSSNASPSSSGAAMGTAMAMGTLSRSVFERVGSLSVGGGILIVLSPFSRSSSGSKAWTAIGRTEGCARKIFSRLVLMLLWLVILFILMTTWVLLVVSRSELWEAATSAFVVGRSVACCDTECNCECLAMIEIVRSFVFSYVVAAVDVFDLFIQLACFFFCCGLGLYFVLCWKEEPAWAWAKNCKHSE